jgi:23S rRNA-/tRNA-specific pseudouridylate synthase
MRSVFVVVVVVVVVCCYLSLQLSPPRYASVVGFSPSSSSSTATSSAQRLRDHLLRRRNDGASGVTTAGNENERRLSADRLGGILAARRGKVVSGRDDVAIPETTPVVQSTDIPEDDPKRDAPLLLEDSHYDRMTLGELRDLLRHRELKVSGSKRELVHRLMHSTTGTTSSVVDPSQRQSPSSSQSNNGDSRSSTTSPPPADADAGEVWSVLEPSVSFVRGITNTAAAIDASEQTAPPPARGGTEYNVELPSLRGLLFVHKPSGYSTLPTKPRRRPEEDDPGGARPGPVVARPCLSDSVVGWLRTNPDGKRRWEEAREVEERWWDHMLRTMSEDPKRRRTMKRTRGERMAKMHTTFVPRPVHRLDVDTSGIVCIALTPYALRAANMMFEKKSRRGAGAAGAGVVGELDDYSEIGIVRKSYVALVEGTLGRAGGGGVSTTTADGVIERAIGKVWTGGDHNEWACDISNDGSTAFIRPGGEDSSKLSFVPGTLRGAVTSYRTLDSTTSREGATTRVELAPHTGRGHQLRLHMASIGHPIVGDTVRSGLQLQ